VITSPLEIRGRVFKLTTLPVQVRAITIRNFTTLTGARAVAALLIFRIFYSLIL